MCNLGIYYDGSHLTAQLTSAIRSRRPEKLCGRSQWPASQARVAITRSRHALDHAGRPPVVRGLIKAYSDVTGKKGYAFAIGGGTYWRCMPDTVAFGPSFPGDIDTRYMPDENFSLEKMMLSIRIMAHAIAELRADVVRCRACFRSRSTARRVRQVDRREGRLGRLNATYLTRAMYRAVGLFMLRNGVPLADRDAIAENCARRGRRAHGRDGGGVYPEARRSTRSARPGVARGVGGLDGAGGRRRMVQLQREIARPGGVMDGAT